MKGRALVELGCGTGMAGIATAVSTMAAFVTLTDGNDEVIELATTNALLNKSVFQGTKVDVRRLEWGDTSEFLKNTTNSDDESFLFDVVLATDSIYDEEVVETLILTAGSILGLKIDSAEVSREVALIVSHVPRCADDNLVSFFLFLFFGVKIKLCFFIRSDAVFLHYLHHLGFMGCGYQLMIFDQCHARVNWVTQIYSALVLMRMPLFS